MPKVLRHQTKKKIIQNVVNLIEYKNQTYLQHTKKQSPIKFLTITCSVNAQTFAIAHKEVKKKKEEPLKTTTIKYFFTES